MPKKFIDYCPEYSVQKLTSRTEFAVLFSQHVGFCVAISVGENHSCKLVQDFLEHWVANTVVILSKDIVALFWNCTKEILIRAS